ncbi:cytidine deaminase-like protein [Catenaria anguillulae PL171]|uniref:Deoxycytidylate deaminase n=1 Tax=Catenaria anguillulae PL171 TaxID=765915 RepID=A0A1Y2HIU9_9FUNG|nr:cytidine deaminase-like protein [Catenaria anguillulae PL171]
MLIILCGPALVGKSTIAHYLVHNKDFQVASVDAQPNHDLGHEHKFQSVNQLESFIMANHRWRQDWVVLGLTRPADIALLHKRPFVLVVAVDAPILTRFHRSGLPTSQLYSFLSSNPTLPSDSASTNATESPHYALQVGADLAIVNDSHSLPQLYAALDACDLLNPQRLRPSWDSYFMSLCHLASQRSNCMKRRVGCLVVSAVHRVLSTGYNGTPRGLPNCANGGCSRCNEATACGVSLDACLCMHAEENALLEIGRGAEGATLYCTTFPCLGCAKKIVQCGIREVVYGHGYSSKSDSHVVDLLFGKVGVAVRMAPKDHGSGGGVGASGGGVQVVVVSSF